MAKIKQPEVEDNEILETAEAEVKNNPKASPVIMENKITQAISALGLEETELLTAAEIPDGRVCVITAGGQKLYWPEV